MWKSVSKQILSNWNRLAIAVAQVGHHLQVKINRLSMKVKSSGFGRDRLIFNIRVLRCNFHILSHVLASLFSYLNQRQGSSPVLQVEKQPYIFHPLNSVFD